jgi:hypothetical protein
MPLFGTAFTYTTYEGVDASQVYAIYKGICSLPSGHTNIDKAESYDEARINLVNGMVTMFNGGVAVRTFYGPCFFLGRYP